MYIYIYNIHKNIYREREGVDFHHSDLFVEDSAASSGFVGQGGSTLNLGLNVRFGT